MPYTYLKQHILVSTITDLRSCRAVLHVLQRDIRLPPKLGSSWDNGTLWIDIRRELEKELGARVLTHEHVNGLAFEIDGYYVS